MLLFADNKNADKLKEGESEMTSPIIKHFVADHLPEGPLRNISMLNCELAFKMEHLLPDGPEKSAGLRKLLEAKDCFVRAALP